MTGTVDPALALCALGLLLGGLFGAVVQASHFCTMGAVSDYVLFGSLRRLRVWALAVATALAGTQGLVLAGLLPPPEAAPGILWAGAVLGGLLFGHGMVLAGGCAAKALVRLGGGSLKALVVLLVMGLAALAVTGGPLAPLARGLGDGLPALGLDAVPAAAGLPAGAARAAATLLLLAPLLLFCLRDPRFRRSRADLATGLALGALVVAGWAGTAALAAPRPESLSFAEPAGGLVLWLATGAGRAPCFAPSAVAGVALGAALVAARAGALRLETFAGRDDMVRHCAGGALMGLGGALALGCSVGQGIAGVSTLSLHALLALGAILAGGAWGVKALETGRLLPRRPGRRAGAAAALPSHGPGA
jgi:uncharacterized protein